VIAVLLARGGRWDAGRPLSEQLSFTEHVEFVSGLRERGVIIEVGPLVDLAAVMSEDPVGLALLDVESVEAAAKVLADDPMVRGGVLGTRCPFTGAVPNGWSIAISESGVASSMAPFRGSSRGASTGLDRASSSRWLLRNSAAFPAVVCLPRRSGGLSTGWSGLLGRLEGGVELH
jgi:uncharacterized protein YciI